MKKKMFSLILAAGILLGNVQAYAQNNIIINVDGKQLNLDTQPVYKNNRILVPFRAIADSMGAEVSWDGIKKSVTCKKNGIILVLTVDSDIMLKNSTAVRLDTTPIIYEGRVLVPARALSEGLGARVNWYSAEGVISIRTDMAQDTVSDEITRAEVEMQQNKKDFFDPMGNKIFIYDCVTPVVKNSGAVADKINNSISANIDYYFELGVEDFKQEAELAASIANAQHASIEPYSLISSAEVTYNQDNILCIVLNYNVKGSSFDYGSWKTDKIIMPLVYNTKTGDIIELSEMVNESTVAKAKGGIISVIKKNENGFYDDYVKLVQNKEPKYYISDKGITFVYDAGYLGKKEKGVISYTISFNEFNK